MRKIFSLLCCISLVVLSLTSCGKELKGLKTEGVLVVGLECAYKPFNWTETEKTDSNVEIDNVKGSYAAGYDIEIAKIIASDLGLTLKVKAIEWDGLIPALKSGSIDAIIAGMSPTDKRRESISFTDKYYESTHVMLVKSNGDLADATSLDDFKGKVVSGQISTIYADLADQVVEKFGAKKGTYKSSVNDILNDMKSNIVDAQVLELPVAKGICASNSDYKYIQFTSGKGFIVNDEDKIVSIGVRKNFTLLDKFNESLAKISEAKRQEIMDKAVLEN